jgi:hypothetical protein
MWVAPFRKSLSLHGRPEARVKWYVIWARRFSASLSGKPLERATREDAERFLSMLSTSHGISAWQVEQAADALTILLGSVFGQDWVRSVYAPHPLLLPVSGFPGG